MERVLLTFGLLLLFGANETAARSKLKGLDLFGTSQISTAQVQRRFGAKFERLAELFPDGDPGELTTLVKNIKAGINRMGKFAYVDLATITYAPNVNDLYITVDVVDERDRAARMTFSPAPVKVFADPDGLIALWDEYFDKAFDLFLKGALNDTSQVCPALHCSFGFEHPALKPYEEPFRIKVPRNKSELVRILHEDRDAGHRAAAAFLLAHIDDANELVQILLPSISDPNENVRNNVMRVFGGLVEKRKDIEIPISPFVKALNYPATTDRNKAMLVLYGLATREPNKAIIIKLAGRLLIKILRLIQPNNHDESYQILREVSGQDYGERDYRSWERWLHRVAS